MKKGIIAGIMLAVVSLVPSVFAGGYGPAGCGLGSIIFEDREYNKWEEVVVAFLNYMMGNQTFGISSGTLNCDADGNKKDKEMFKKAFVKRNYDSLTKEMAAGKGEHLEALATLLGCEDNLPLFKDFIRRNYASIFETENIPPSEMLDLLETGLDNDSRLSRSCKRSTI